MKDRKILRTRKVWKDSKIILNLTLLFWLLETLFFIIKDGFHWKAETKAEMICDSIVTYGFYTFLALFTMVVVNVVEYLLSYDEE